MKALAIVTLSLVGAGTLALVGALAARHASSFWTDAGTISQPPDAPVRSILWQPARSVAGVNTSVDEYEPKYSPDGTMMVFVRRKPGRNADLFMSRWSPSGWSSPEAMTPINSDADELGPEIASDAESLYFYSDRAGGHGGYDLWVSHRVNTEWTTPQNLGDAVNTEFNEYGPALTPDRRTLYFSSDRARAGEEMPPATPWDATMRERHARHDYDLYQAGMHDGAAERARPLEWANTAQDEGAPAVSPAGDYLYFSSDRGGGLGGYDLYRARINDPRRHVVENLGDAVNSCENELDPGLSTDGFRLTFSSDRDVATSEAATSGAAYPEGVRLDRDYNLWSTASREVFLDHRPVGPKLAQWLDAAWPWLLVLLLATLLLWLLARLLRSEVWRRRFAQMSLLARCLLVSLVIHALIASLLTIWKVGSYLGELMQSGGTRVVLASSAAEMSGDITSQFATTVEPPEAPRLESRDLEPPRIELPAPEVSTTIDPRTHADVPPAVASMAPSPSPTEAEPPRDSNPVALTEPSQAREVLPTADAPRKSSAEAAMSQPALGAASTPLQHVPINADVTPAKLSARVPKDTGPAVPAGESPRPAPSDGALSPSQLGTLEAARLLEAASMNEAALPTAERPTRVTEAPATSSTASLPSATMPRPSEAIEAPASTAPLAARAPAQDASITSLPTLTAVPAMPIPEPLSSARGVGADTTSLPARAPMADAPLPPVERPTASRSAPEPSAALSPALDLPKRSLSPAAPIELPPVEVAPAAMRPRETSSAPMISLPAPGPSPVPLGDAPPLSELSRAMTMPSSETHPTLPPGLPQPVEDFAQRAPEQRSELVEKMGGSQETERAVARALEWLKRAQESDGRWSSKKNGGEVNADTAMTGMALLCFLSAGHTHTQDGPYRETVSRAIEHLVSRQQADGDLAPDETMYGQTIASVALCEAYAMTHDARLARAVKLAVEFVDASARSNDGSAGRTSVLGWQVMAMESARRAGVKTSNITFDAARRWLDSVASAGAPGRYAYQRGQAASPAMTAEAMFVQQLLGRGSGEARMQDSARFILEAKPRWQDGAPTHYWYYATLAMFQQQGEAWREWNDALVPELLSHQRTEGELAGSWDPQDRWSKLCGRVHQTAVCTLSLEVYYRYKTRAE